MKVGWSELVQVRLGEWDCASHLVRSQQHYLLLEARQQPVEIGPDVRFQVK